MTVTIDIPLTLTIDTIFLTVTIDVLLTVTLIFVYDIYQPSSFCLIILVLNLEIDLGRVYSNDRKCDHNSEHRPRLKYVT